MYTNNHNIAKNFSNHLKNNPLEFNAHLSNLINNFMSRMEINLPDSEIIKLHKIYKFICMYSIITGDLNTVYKLMRNPKIIITIIDALIINGNLVLKQNSKLVDAMISYGHKHINTLSEQDTIAICALYFNAHAFYKAIKYVSNINTNKIN